MNVREATFEDMGNILDFLEKYHETSNLSDIPFDRRSCAKIVEYAIAAKDTIALVAEELSITGILLGTLEPFFFNRKKSYATDILFISTSGGGPQMWRRFKEWAFYHGAERLMMGVSSGDARADQLLEALGMTNTGGMYVLRRKSS